MDAVETAVLATVADATALATASVPVIIGLAAIFVAIKLGKRVLGKI